MAQLEDYYTQHFFGVNRLFDLGDGQSLTADARYFATGSSGANASASGYKVNGYNRNSRGEIDNRTWSAMLTYELSGHALSLGYQQVSDDSDFVQLNQGSLADKGAGGVSYYLYTNRLSGSFNRAGERTALAEYTYDFAASGLPGLNASVAYLKGSDIMTKAGPTQTEWERDISIDYVIQSGALKGVGFGWRNAMVRSQATADLDQNRLIVSYNLALF